MSKDPKMVERDELLKQRWFARMEADFNPVYTPEHTPQSDVRMVNAAEYAAYQLGQINRSMGRLIELLEKAEEKKG